MRPTACRRLSWLKTFLLALFMGGLGTLILLFLPVRIPVQFDGFKVEVGVHLFRQGETILRLPPLGEISAATHHTPLALEVTLLEASSQGVRGVLTTSQNEGVIQTLGSNARRLAGELLVGLSLAGVLLGALAGRILSQKPRWFSLLTGMTGGGMTFILLVATVWSYDPGAFRQPKYRGALSAAPWMMELAEKGLAELDSLGERLQVISDNLAQTMSRLEAGEPGLKAGGDLRILHVSDLHNNPAAVKFMSQVIRNFQVDAVVDTGDLTDYGTAIEMDLLGRISQLRVPYFFVPGNHDRQQALRVAGRFPNFHLLEGETTFHGLRIWGVPHPAFRTNQGPGENDLNWEQIGTEMLARLTQGSPPDVLAVHDPRLARKAAGTVPVILYGHTHRLKVSLQESSVLIDAGTTGAAGLRGLADRKSPGYSLALLYFSRVAQNGKTVYHLRAVDTIRVDNLKHTFLLERTFFLPEE